MGIPLPENKPIDTGRELYTANKKWFLMRAEAAEDAASALDLTASDNDFVDIVVNAANVNATEGLIDILSTIGYGANALEFAFFSDSADSANDTFDFELFAYRDGDSGPPVKVYSTTSNACLMGTQIVQTHPTLGTTVGGLWCDTISGTDHWKNIDVIDSGNNGICRLILDRRGYRFFWVRIFNAGGGGTECAGVGVVVSGY